MMNIFYRLFRSMMLVATIATTGMTSSVLAEGDIRVTGSSTIAPLMLEISKRYSREHENSRIFVETGGSSKGLADLRKGLSDIAMVSRNLNAEEGSLVAHTIARDGVAVLVRADNPVENISPEKLRAIFSGQITNWSELGGTDAEIMVISKGEGRATSVVFNDFLGLTASQIEGDMVAAENAQMIKMVAQTAGSIGYVSIGAAVVNIELGVPVKLVPLGEIPPTIKNVSNGRYQATRPLNLVTFPDISPEISNLIDYCRSDEVVDLVEGLTYSPVSK